MSAAREARDLRHRVSVSGGARILRLAVALLGGTCRVVVTDPDALTLLRSRQAPAILVLWHRQLFLCCYLFHRSLVRSGVPLTVLVSRSRDGDFGARLGGLLGARVVRGSSSRGGGAALRVLAREVQRARWPVMIPDGPRGPAGVAKAGPLALSRLTGAPVVPLGLAADRCWRLGSWDGTLIPRPFSRLSLHVGEALASLGDTAAEIRELGTALDRAERSARQALGLEDGCQRGL
jgi:lysophospholipid acyltransferase (LPLAT)-like uncharacterized protein